MTRRTATLSLSDSSDTALAGLERADVSCFRRARIASPDKGTPPLSIRLIRVMAHAPGSKGSGFLVGAAFDGSQSHYGPDRTVTPPGWIVNPMFNFGMYHCHRTSN